MSSSSTRLDFGDKLVTPENESTAVGIATWLLASSFLVMYLSGQSVKYAMLRRFKLDDGFLLLGIIFALSLSIAYSVAASNGLGKKHLADAQLVIIQKAYYAADILYVSSLSSVKLSLLVFIRQIVVDMNHTRFILSLISFQSLIAVASLFASAFQCMPPYTWNTLAHQCFNQSKFWVAFGVLDIFTDVSIILASIVIVWTVHVSFSRKMIVVGCFAPRLLVVAAAIARLAFLVPISPNDHWAWRSWIPVVTTEVQVCLSIATACIPSVKPLFEAVEAGVWHADDLRRRGLSLEDLHSRGYLKVAENLIVLSDMNSGVVADDSLYLGSQGAKKNPDVGSLPRPLPSDGE
ncbi:hypothetical protein F4824DRAFT_472564 [Ustulina deusta]|nr:hypothetical protein F4824DRAFT_472564 [Ustulina deusta]